MTWLDAVYRFIRWFGPLLLIVVLPGGTLLALLLYLRRNGRLGYGNAKAGATRSSRLVSIDVSLARELASA